jgi:hypothetical protein
LGRDVRVAEADQIADTFGVTRQPGSEISETNSIHFLTIPYAFWQD